MHHVATEDFSLGMLVVVFFCFSWADDTISKTVTSTQNVKSLILFQHFQDVDS